MSVDPVPSLIFSDPWSVRDRADSWAAAELALTHADGGSCTVRVERCVAGRLQSAYPASTKDLELQLLDASAPRLLTSVLEKSVAAVRAADPDCRRIVFGAPRAVPGAVAAAEAAGFRYVLDVDLPDTELSLLVCEPEWVAVRDDAADTVPEP